MVAKAFRRGIKSVCALSAQKFATFAMFLHGLYIPPVKVKRSSSSFHFFRAPPVHRRVIVTYCFVPLVMILFYFISLFFFLSPSFNSVCTQKTVLKRSTLPNLRIKIVQFWI